MDKQEDEDVSAASVSGNVVIVGGGGVDACGEETLDGSEGFGGEGVGFMGERDGFSNGDDIMVGVLDSDVYVDGVCRPRDEGHTGSEVCCDGLIDGELGRGGDAKSMGDGDEQRRLVEVETAAEVTELVSVVNSGEREKYVFLQSGMPGRDGGDTVGSVGSVHKQAQVMSENAVGGGTWTVGQCNQRNDIAVASAHQVNTEEVTICEDKVLCNIGKVNAESLDEPTSISAGYADEKGDEVFSSLAIGGIESFASDENLAHPRGVLVANIQVVTSESKVSLNDGNHLPNKDNSGRVVADKHLDASTSLNLQAEVNCPSEALDMDTHVIPESAVLNSSHDDLDGPGDDKSLAQTEAPVTEKGAPTLAQIDPDMRAINVGEQTAGTGTAGLRHMRGMAVEDKLAGDVKQKEAEETNIDLEDMKLGSSMGVNRVIYKFPRENEDVFSVHDLVWGKVKSHPWWPGQIFDLSDSSEKAMKYYRKDCFLVAYFGDRSFAWNEASSLKPFHAHFSTMVLQSSSETFQYAVNCALDEVSRRVELGLSCSCTPKHVYDNVKVQVVENPGIREESSSVEGVYESASANSFRPDKLLEYLKMLAQAPSDGGDRLDLVISKAQLLVFYRQKGYSMLPEVHLCGELVEGNGVVFGDGRHVSNNTMELATPISSTNECIASRKEGLKAPKDSFYKRKHNLMDIANHGKKERSLAELMGDALDYPADENDFGGKPSSKLSSTCYGKKRKVLDQHVRSAASDGRKSICLAKVDSIVPSFSRPSFKVGESILRVASELTGSSILKCNSEVNSCEDGSELSFQKSEDARTGDQDIPSEYWSVVDFLSQLHVAALDPMREYSLLNAGIKFFSDFKSLVSVGADSAFGGVTNKRKKSSELVYDSSDMFEFEDMNDSYWTDRIIGNGFEEQVLDDYKKGEGQFTPIEAEKPRKVSHRANSKRRELADNSLVEKPAGYIDGNSPAELVLFFPGFGCVPSEASLNKTMKRFGPLKESDTELDIDTNRARVVFKRCSDAEVAFNSAQKFSIFGPMDVNYQLNYSPSYPFKTSCVSVLELEGFEGIF